MCEREREGVELQFSGNGFAVGLGFRVVDGFGFRVVDGLGFGVDELRFGDHTV